MLVDTRRAPATSLDFSDTVTVLDVVGVGIDEVANADDFAARFIV